jgi:polygalacturonase
MKYTKSILQSLFLWLTASVVTGAYPSGPHGEPVSVGFEVTRPSFAEREYLITEFGAINDGISLNTESINEAILTCSEAGGGRVVIPEGVWVTGPIRLQDNVDLHVAEGALVQFSGNFDDYPFVPSYFEGRKVYRAMPLLFGDSLSNIAITGKGVFDGSGGAWRPVKKMKTTESQWRNLVNSGGVVNDKGDIWWPSSYAYEVSKDPEKYMYDIGNMPDRDLYKAYFRPPLVQLISCDTVLLEGPMFQNSPGWCIHPVLCSQLTVNDIMVVNPWYAQNGDGIDVESCKYVSIRNSNFDVGDDAICIKSGKNEEGRRRGVPTQYVEVDNCIVHHGHGGFVVGSEMSGGVKDIWVSNCTFLGTDVGLRFKSTRGRGGVVENIHIDRIRMINIARDAIIFNLFYAGLAPTEMGENPVENLLTNAPPVSEETPVFRNIHISNINCQGADHALQIMGLPEMPVKGLTLENSVFSTERGVSCLFASDLSLSEVLVRTGDHPTVTLTNVQGAEIKGVEGNHAMRFHVAGSATREIVIGTADEQALTEKLATGDQVVKGAVKIIKITGN